MNRFATNLYSKIATNKTRATLLAILILLLPFERIPSFDIASITVRPSQLVALALILLSAGQLIRFYANLPRWPKLLLPAFLFSYTLSTLLATDARRAAMVYIFTVFTALVASAVAINFDRNQLDRLEKFLYIGTGLALLVGFYQYFGDVFGISPELTGLRSNYVKEIFGFPRIQSTALEPLYYGSFLLIPYCLLLAKRLRQAAAITRAQTVLFVLIVTQLLLTVSRGAIYGAILATVTLIVSLLIKRDVAWRAWLITTGWLVVGSTIALALTWIPTYFIKDSKISGEQKTERLLEQTGNFDSQDDRVRNRQYALEAFKEAPWLGIGPGNFNQYAIAKYPPYSKSAPVIVNNEPLELLAEAGLIGTLLLALFVIWHYIMAAKTYFGKNVLAGKHNYWVPALLIYLVALALQYQTFSTLYITHVWVILGLIMGLNTQSKRPNK